MAKLICFLLLSSFNFIALMAQAPVPVKPRILISTDIGGTDPDWFTDKSDEDLFDKNLHGFKTVSKWRVDAMIDWGKRWSWLR